MVVLHELSVGMTAFSPIVLIVVLKSKAWMIPDNINLYKVGHQLIIAIIIDSSQGWKKLLQ